MKVEDLSFSAKTEITATRNEYIHGLLVYFQCEFSKTKGPVRFSTGPFDEYTHWKQTIFYLHVSIRYPIKTSHYCPFSGLHHSESWRKNTN